MDPDYNLELPISCPFSARRLNEFIFLFREHDEYGQYPNIYAKICSLPEGASESRASVIVLSDAGCATSLRNDDYRECSSSNSPEFWNIYTVLRHTINPGGKLPYLVITSHCHFDHIMGIGLLPPTDSHPGNGDISQRQGPPTTVLSSAFDPDYINPWEHLCCHSLCKAFQTVAPHYTVGMWAQDNEHVVYSSASLPAPIPTGIIILQTPGHTPDSLAWFDTDSHLLFVGDSFYEVSSADTLVSKWGGEPRGPIMFEERSNLADWWKSLHKVLTFTREMNAKLARKHVGDGPAARVAIAAAHVTTSSPDAEAYILSVRAFFSRVLRNEVPQESIEADWLPFKDLTSWDDGPEAAKSKDYEWMVWAPRRIIEEGREQIPKEEWI